MSALDCPDVITFKRVKVERVSINERLKKKNITKDNYKSIEVTDNPYQMFTISRNTFNINWIEKR
jgi:hypothetical protein